MLEVVINVSQDSGSSRWKQSLNHVSSNLGAGGIKGRASFLHKKPGCSSGGTSGQFVCRGADGKGGRTTVLKAASLQHSGVKVGQALVCANTMKSHLHLLASKVYLRRHWHRNLSTALIIVSSHWCLRHMQLHDYNATSHKHFYPVCSGRCGPQCHIVALLLCEVRVPIRKGRTRPGLPAQLQSPASSRVPRQDDHLTRNVRPCNSRSVWRVHVSGQMFCAMFEGMWVPYKRSANCKAF